MTSETTSESNMKGNEWLKQSKAARVHHSAIYTRDIERSLRFYRDGVGMDVLSDQIAPGASEASKRPRIIFLGSEEDQSAGVVELVMFGDGSDTAPPVPFVPEARVAGFYTMAIYTDAASAIERLAGMGYEPESRRDFEGPNGPVSIAMIRDPQGVLVELISVAGGS